ncbi:DUF4388 domain-containing protein [Anaeromyxobacter dehalogenans]|uniref:DUF4388 domain-containing protein n=1 Tax=Anaeromyxobacter dehalogenans TaxID=161493 RepID=UPI00030C67D8|nr:DUF4388 domain-containing protein [Anaeromyxobacter dehalogenans]
MRGLMGSFAVLPLGELVELLARRAMTGALTCERGSVRKTLQLRGGAAVAAASNDPREFLGQLLVNYGHLTEAQLQKAFETQEQTRVRLGRVLVMVGLVAPETVREVLAIKIRETLLDVFLWDSGVFTFDDAPPAAVDELDPEVPLAEIAREAEFRATAWSAFRAQFPSGAATLVVDEARVPPGLAPGTVDGRLLALARAGKTIDELGLALNATDFHLHQRLYALANQGVVRAAPPPAPERGAADAEREAAELVERARGLLADGHADEAELAAARAAELAPGWAPARAARAEAEAALGERLQAELLGATLRPAAQVSAPDLARMRLPAADRYLLSRCDGKRSVAELVRAAPMRELDVLKALRRFADSGLVVL